MNKFIILEASRGGGAQSVTVNAVGYGLNPQLTQFIFLFLGSGVEGKRGTDFRH